MKKELAGGFTAEVDGLTKERWNDVVAKFDDAYIYHTWSYEQIHSGEKSLSHLILKKDGKMVAAAQLRVVKFLFNAGVAYLRWGPMWRLKGEERNLEVFTQALRAIRNEYVRKRGLVLRILPLLFDDEADVFTPIFAAEDFGRPLALVTQKTLLIDLRKSPDELRKGLHEKWRYSLKVGEKNNLTVLEGPDDRLFPLFMQTYAQTLARKGFAQSSDVNKFRAVQQDLPEEFRMRLCVVLCGDVPAAGVICSRIGNTGLLLFGGTSDAGLKSQASFVAHWRALLWLKEQGATQYNLAGINPVTNPGSYRFKTRFCGSNGREVCSLGTFDACEGFITKKIFQYADLAREMQRRHMVYTKAGTT